MPKYIDFNDESIPLGKRKQAYIRWAVYKKGKSMDEAKILANRKFGFEKKGKILALYHIRSPISRFYSFDEAIFWNYDLRKYKEWKAIEVPVSDCGLHIKTEYAKKIEKEYKDKGWKVFYRDYGGD